MANRKGRRPNLQAKVAIEAIQRRTTAQIAQVSISGRHKWAAGETSPGRFDGHLRNILIISEAGQ
jgi:hypothetical protein